MPPPTSRDAKTIEYGRFTERNDAMNRAQTTVVVFASKILASAFGFVATVYFARVLGAEVYGYYTLAISLVAWLKLGGEMGIGSAITKRISEENEPNAHFAAGAVILGGLALLLTVVIRLFEPYINNYIGTSVTPFIVVLLLVGLFYSYVDAALKGFDLVHISGGLTPVMTALRSVAQIGLVFAGWELIGMLTGYAISNLVIGFVGLFLLSVQVERPKWRHARSLFDYAKYSWLSSLKSRSFSDVDIIVLGLFVPSALIGVYGVAWSLATVLTIFGTALTMTLFPEMSRISAQEDRQAVSEMITDSLAFGGLILIPGLFGGYLLSDRLLLLYSSEFTRGKTVLWILILACLLYGYQKQLMNSLNAIDRPDLSFRVNGIFILSNFILNLGLVWRFGIVGAAVATTIAAGFSSVLAYYILSRIVDFRFPALEIGRQFAAAAIMSVCVSAAESALESAALISRNTILVVFLVAFGGSAYFATLILISRKFRGLVTRNVFKQYV